MSRRPPPRALLAAGELARRARERHDPLEAIDWLPGQLEFLKSTARIKLLRCGTQVGGKTTAGLAECVWLATGRHPWQPGRIAKRIWVVCTSWSQSIAIQKKLWDLLNEADLDPRCEFDPVAGFRGRYPVARFANGSLIFFKTTGQKSGVLASDTVDHALCDEPPDQRKYGELVSRTMTSRGTISITMTPLNAPCEFLRELVGKGQIEDLHHRLTPDAMIHTRSGMPRVLPDGTVCDEAWIASVRADVLPWEEPVVVDGEWEERATDRYFPAFVGDYGVKGSHVKYPPSGKSLRLLLGIDHGVKLGKSCLTLVGVDESKGVEAPTIYVLGEVRASDRSTIADDAKAILAVIRGQGFQWKNLDEVWGDIPAGTGAAKRGNLDFEDAIRRELGVTSRDHLSPRVGTAKQEGPQRGMVVTGVKYLHQAMLGGRFFVSPDCPATIEALKTWDGTSDHKAKDSIDALRYALRSYVTGRRKPRASGPSPTLRVR